MRLVLASSSPRRRDLLSQAGFVFEVWAADIDETRLPHEAATAYVQRLALQKAQTVHALFPDAVVLGADTTVALDGEVLNKPMGAADAERMLRALAGRTHQVYTGVAVVAAAAQRVHLETTLVTFSAIPDAEMARYIASGEPLDKAGAYGIQGFAARWIPRIEGDYSNVVGLPVAATVRLLAAVGDTLGNGVTA